MNRVLLQFNVPNPMERKEEEWVREEDEVNSLSVSVRVPADVMERRGEEVEVERLTVKESSGSE